MKTTFIFLLCFNVVTAWFFSGPDWNGLKVTFGVNPFNSNYFDSMPRQESQAVSQGWTKISGCNDVQKFRGNRYILGGDYAVVLVYDVNGYIAGIQTGIAKAGLPSNYPPQGQRGQMFQEHGSHYYLTAYFINPDRICRTGRSASVFQNTGTGSELFIQNGPNPDQSMLIPTDQDDLSGTSWSLGHCFVAMGTHYWYDLSLNMDCDNFKPVFLLYNSGKLTGFGWAMAAQLTSSRYEHPSKSAFSKFMDPVPTCLYDHPHLSTMHIYLTNSPRTNLCIF